MHPYWIALAIGLSVSFHHVSGSDPASVIDARAALKPFNDLIGSWRCTGTPEGTREEKRRGFWTETMTWEWRFKGNDAWLHVAIPQAKHFVEGELHALPQPAHFRLTLRTSGKESLAFSGMLKDKSLAVERVESANGSSQRLVFEFLHSNRFVYRFEEKPKASTRFTLRYQVGATKEGEAFAGRENAQPECIVSGGLGKIKVSYHGKDYYVCCGGCRTAFLEEPEKFIKEYQAKQKGKK